MLGEQKCDLQDVAAIITAMTDGEQPFLRNTVEAVLCDPGIGQAILCIEQKNAWVDTALGSLITDPRLEIIRIPMMPPGAARNQALSNVRMPWIAYCDGDDVWCKGKTIIQRSYASTTGCDFVAADHYLTDEGGRVRAFALARYFPMTSSWMVRAEIMNSHPFNESLYQGEDGEWWIRTTGIVQRVRCPKMLVRYRVRSGSLSSTTPSKRRKAKIVAFASIPVLGASILFFTWCIWLSTRQKKYIWLKAWGSEHCTNSVQAMEEG